MVPCEVVFCLFVRTAWNQVRCLQVQFDRVDEVYVHLHLHAIEKGQFLLYLIALAGSPLQTAWKPTMPCFRVYELLIQLTC